MAFWGLSVVFYLGAVFATLILPVPHFGITHSGAHYGIPGSGEWVSHPQIPIAAGLLYFSALGVSKVLATTSWSKALGQKIVESQSRKSSSAASR